jgi:LacI family transcriptional regulator
MARVERSNGSATIIDVAREAGVSYATVSRVINNKAHVKPEKREAVLEAMQRLGYVVNQQARSLAGGRSHIIGLLVQDLISSWMGQIIRGIDEELVNAQYDLMIYTSHRRKAAEASYAAISHGLADGVLLIIPRNVTAYIGSLREQSFPHVLIDCSLGDRLSHSVEVANWEGAYQATTYLIGLGHHRIGFVTGQLEMESGRDRLAGFQAALHDHGIQLDPSLIIEGNYLQQRGFEAGQQLLSRPDRPTAIFASNDASAFGVIDAAHAHGLRLPDDLSILGFDDIPEAASIHPALTTVRQPLEQMGRIGTQILIRALDDPDMPIARVVLPTELIIRRSCIRVE